MLCIIKTSIRLLTSSLAAVHRTATMESQFFLEWLCQKPVFSCQSKGVFQFCPCLNSLFSNHFKFSFKNIGGASLKSFSLMTCFIKRLRHCSRAILVFRSEGSSHCRLTVPIILMTYDGRKNYSPSSTITNEPTKSL